MSDISPQKPPTARSYLDQQLFRLRLAIKGIRTEFVEIEKRMRELETDLVHVEAALDQIEEDARAAPPDRGAA